MVGEDDGAGVDGAVVEEEGGLGGAACGGDFLADDELVEENENGLVAEGLCDEALLGRCFVVIGRAELYAFDSGRRDPATPSEMAEEIAGEPYSSWAGRP